MMAEQRTLRAQTQYYVDLATGVPKSVANELKAELQRKGFENVQVILVDSIP